MKNEVNEVGIIGQVYEDRRNGKSGKLVSRDKKCKTLLFESENGSTFVVTFSTFRSNMRKKIDANPEDIKEEAYAEPEITSQELTEEEATKIEKKIERKEKKQAKAKAIEEADVQKKLQVRIDAYTQMKSVLHSFVDSFNNANVEYKDYDNKYLCTLKVRNKCLMQFYSRSKLNEVYVVSVPELFPAIQPSVAISKCRHHGAKSANHLTEAYSIADSDMAQLLEDYKDAIIEILSYTRESEV